jgi:membrane fusion protein (multidrug efflux system)
VRIRVTETGGLLRPGMFARVAIVYERKPDALQIPRTALLDGDGPPKVFVVKNGKAMERAVKLGLSNGAWIEVTEGLKDGEQVVVVGQGAVKPGAAVRVVNSSARPAASRLAPAAAG